MGIGLYLPTWPPKGAAAPRWTDIRSLARRAEAAGIDTLWVADEPGFWELWTIVTAAAEATERIQIGPLVACTRYRNPALVATMVRALDEVSGGRLVVGIGAGAGPTDPRLAAFGFDTGPEHVGRFAEAAEILVRLLREGPISFEGRFHRVANPDIGPAGPRPTGPPIWMAAGRPRTMGIAARWADAVNGADGLTDAASVEALREQASRACATVGRDPGTLALTGWARLAISSEGRRDADRADTISGTPEEVADRLGELAEAGLHHVACFIGDPTDDHLFPALTESALDAFVPVIERLRSGAVAQPGVTLGTAAAANAAIDG
jgi:alkanesulfonate monooxygenase SsuD/methylene tetrahydromethanopterin reductase-like flavin-dependent oxidoreductase (luciferase family)